MLGLPPAFVLSQDQTLKLNENLVLAGHFLYDESQAHLPATPRAYAQENRKHDELRYVTARVSHRPHTLHSHINECDPQGLRRPRFSFFRFNCQTAKPKFKQRHPVEQYNLLNQATGLHPDTETLSPRFAQPGGFEARETREKRSAPAAQGSAAVGARLIGRARSHCQPAFSKNFQKAP